MPTEGPSEADLAGGGGGAHGHVEPSSSAAMGAVAMAVIGGEAGGTGSDRVDSRAKGGWHSPLADSLIMCKTGQQHK